MNTTNGHEISGLAHHTFDLHLKECGGATTVRGTTPASSAARANKMRCGKIWSICCVTMLISEALD